MTSEDFEPYLKLSSTRVFVEALSAASLVTSVLTLTSENYGPNHRAEDSRASADLRDG